MRTRFLLALLGAFLALPLVGQANNLRIFNLTSRPELAGPAGHTRVRFDVSWENSWRDSVNWDAAWLFVKYRDSNGDGRWHTARLSPLDAAHSVPPGTALNAAADSSGVLIYRRTAGAGTLTVSGVELDWDWAGSGIAPDSMLVTRCEFRVFGVEMVYVPQGAFNLNATESGRLANEFVGIQGSVTRIFNEAPLATGAIRWRDDNGAGGTGNAITVNGNTYPGSDSLHAAYPKGFAAAYCMKYEVTQGQYTDFLNSLTRIQQRARVAVDIRSDSPLNGLVYVMAEVDDSASAFRNTITCPRRGMGTSDPVTFSCSRPDRVANFLIWADAAAYLDWAGLRPMSELEFEKISRGPALARPHDLAWGPDSAVAALNIFGGLENGTETTDPGANMVFGFQTFVGGDGSNGPLRAGIFASLATTRAQAGASYYGVMELSGNCWERCVTVAGTDGGLATDAGLFERNRHGDGELDAQGEHNVLHWPAGPTALGSNFRGGNWSRPAEWAMTADRQYGGQAISGRTSHRGIRGVRAGGSLTGLPYGTGGTAFSPTKYYGGAYDGYEGTPTQQAGLLITGLRARLGERPVVVTPNPVSGGGTALLHLAAGSAPLRHATLVLTDALGRPVRRRTALQGLRVEMPCVGLVAGMYFYHLSDSNAPITTGRLVVQ